MNYYTYVIIDPRNKQPFYVGKGTGNRMYSHWLHRNLKNNGNVLVKQKMKKIELEKLKPIYEKILYNVNQHMALQKEIELVKLYGRLDIGTGILCNFTNGGEAGSSSWSPQTRQRKRDIELAKKKGNPVTQYTLNGLFLNSFSSAKVASEHVLQANRSYITQVCKGRRKSAGGFLWTYKGICPSVFNKKYYHPVNQYTLDGNLINTFRSVTEAAKHVNLSIHAISCACRNVSKTSAGFIWKYI